MKKHLIAFALSAGLTGFATASDSYNLDSTHSYVEFHYNHMGFSNPSGKWFATGSLQLDQKDIANSSAKINIQVADIVTGIPKLDEHLKSADFFDVAKYPQATFISTKIDNIKGKQFDMVGTLTLHGISKPLTLHVTPNQVGMNPVYKVQTAGFSATGSFKRSEFGLAAYVPAVSDEVQLNIQVEGQLVPVKK